MKHIIYIALSSFLLFSFSSDKKSNTKKDVQELFDKVNKKYESYTFYSMKSDYTLYPSHKGKVPYLKSEVFIVGDKNNYYTKIDEVELIGINSNYIKIDNKTKKIQLSENTNANATNLLNISKFLDNFEKFEITTNHINYVCKLHTPAFSMLPYSSIEVTINKESLLIEKQVFYYLIAQKLDKNSSEDYPRLEMFFKELNTVKTPQLAQLLKKERYIVKSNNAVLPSKNYKGYTIID